MLLYVYMGCVIKTVIVYSIIILSTFFCRFCCQVAMEMLCTTQRSQILKNGQGNRDIHGWWIEVRDYVQWQLHRQPVTVFLYWVIYLLYTSSLLELVTQGNKHCVQDGFVYTLFIKTITYIHWPILFCLCSSFLNHKFNHLYPQLWLHFCIAISKWHKEGPSAYLSNKNIYINYISDGRFTSIGIVNRLI